MGNIRCKPLNSTVNYTDLSIAPSSTAWGLLILFTLVSGRLIGIGLLPLAAHTLVGVRDVQVWKDEPEDLRVPARRATFDTLLDVLPTVNHLSANQKLNKGEHAAV